MKPWKKCLIVGALQIALVASLAAKMLIDRVRCPRVWARVQGYDPDLIIRGRYLSLQLIAGVDGPDRPVRTPDRPGFYRFDMYAGILHEKNGRLAVTFSADDKGERVMNPIVGPRNNAAQDEVVVVQPVLFFLPEHAENPWQQARGAELWAEVTLPKSGPPRPIRLAVKRGETFTPIETK